MSATLLGIMIRQRRQSKGWSQEELAKRLQGTADQAAISRLENGLIGDPGAKLIFHLSNALGVTANELLTTLCTGDTEADAVQGSAPEAKSQNELITLRDQAQRIMERIDQIQQEGAAATK